MILDGNATYSVDKKRLFIRLTAPYSEKLKKVSSEGEYITRLMIWVKHRVKRRFFAFI